MEALVGQEGDLELDPVFVAMWGTAQRLGHHNSSYGKTIS